MSKKKDYEVIELNTREVSTGREINQELAQKFKQAKKKKIGIHDFVEDFLNQFVSEQTKKAYLKDLQFFFDFLKSGGEYVGHPRDINAHHFQFYRDDMIERGLASATINRRLVCIRSFMKWSLAAKLINHNPLDVVKLPKVETESPTLAFDDEEVVAMIDAPDLTTKKGVSHRMVLVMLFTLGLRRSELVNIRLKDFYTERGHNVLRIKGKGRKERHIPVNEFLYNELTNYVNALVDHGITLTPEDYLVQSHPKFKNEAPMDGSTVFRIVDKYKKQLGITKRVSPHSCRATVISHLLDTQKTPIRDVAIFAGHSKITTTERYDKRRKGLDDSAAYQVDYLTKKSG